MTPTVLGADGRLGRAFWRLRPRWQYLGRSFRVRPDFNPEGPVINCIAYNHVDEAETPAGTQKARYANVAIPSMLAVASAEHAFSLIHFSSDFVFSGDNVSRPLTESDTPFPLGVYGASKFHGENAVLAIQPDALIIRTSWLYGSQDAFPIGESDVPCRIGSPTFAPDLALEVVTAIEAGNLPSGIFHVANRGQACRPLDFENRKAARPSYSVLDPSRWETHTGRAMRSWQETKQDWETNR